ncbi:MAG TPA: sigma-70 family RNA polymerase sigma factor [Candidatus Hydrogenedentes bacterium]|nr:sigma-70 family RNA polymerase sigma factor [Candidatus Hydrogenedentota bacterium]
MNTESTDLTLLERWLEGRDAEAFRQIAMRHSGMLYATSRRILRNETEAEDVVQECFETLARARRQPKTHLSAWLHKMATNLSLNRIRSEKRRKKREQHFAMASRPFAAPHSDDIYAYVDEAIAELPVQLRVPVIRCFLEGQSHDAIAREIGASRQTVTYRIKKGVEQIRRHLRRNRIAVSAVTVTSLLAADRATAAEIPVALMTKLGKLAIAGMANTGGRATTTVLTQSAYASVLGGLLVMKKAILGCVLLVAAVLAVLWSTTSPERAQEPPAPMSTHVTGSAEKDVDYREPTPTQEPTLKGTMTVVQREPEADRSEAAGGSISGIVVAPSGRPEAGITIIASTPGWGGALPTSVSDEDGRFTISGLRRGKYGLCIWPRNAVRAEVAGRASAELKDGEHVRDVKIVTGDYGLVIAGTVTNTKGARLEGAQVYVVRADQCTNHAWVDQEGHYRILGLTEGFYTIGASASGYLMAQLDEVPAGAAGVDIVLAQAPRIAGRVVETRTNQPVSEFEVGLSPAIDDPLGFTLQMVSFTPVSGDSRGRFELRWNGEGDVAVIARAAGFQPGFAIANVGLGEHNQEVVIKLHGGCKVEGLVVTSSGKPVAGAQVAVGTSPYLASNRSGMAAANSDDEGAFKLDALQPTSQIITAFHPDHGSGAVEVFPRVTDVTRVKIKLGGAGDIEGTVLAGRELLRDPLVFAGGQYVHIKPDWSYRISGLTPGLARVRVNLRRSSPDGLSRSFEQALVVEGNGVVQADLDIPTGTATLMGAIDYGDLPCTDIRMCAWVQTPVGVMKYDGSLGTDNTYVIEGVAPGYVEMQVWRCVSIKPRTTTIAETRMYRFDIGEDESLTHDVHFVGGASILAQVTGHHPEDRVWIDIYTGQIYMPEYSYDGMKPYEVAAVRLLDGGAQRIEALEAGTYTVVARVADVDPLLGFAHAIVDVVNDQEIVVDLALP